MPPPADDGTALADRYRLESAIGRGGMGTVWRAEDTRLRRPVAIKDVPLPHAMADEERSSTRARVMREAQAAARLSLPQSVTVFDVLEEEGHLYLVMELVEAPSLEEVVEGEGPLDPGRAAAVGLELLDALEAAHRSGVVHRDVKPGNVLVLPDGQVKLTDFGIASLRDDPRITATGMVIGSPAYMAPEQAQGGEITPAADLWSLGTTLYFAVEGESPFDREGAMATLNAVVHAEPRPCLRAGPLEPVLLGLMVKEPADRLLTGEVRRQLGDIAGEVGREAPANVAAATPEPAAVVAAPVAAVTVAPEPTVDPPPTTPVPTPPKAPAFEAEPVVAREPDRSPLLGARRPRRWGRALAATAVVLLVVAAVVLWGGGGDDDPEVAGDQDAPATTTAPASTVAPSSDEGDDGPPATADTDAGQAEVPSDWEAYDDPDIGYQLSHPPDWVVEPVDATRTDFRDPETGSYLRVDWTDSPGPSAEQAWRDYAPTFAAEHQGYEEIRIETTEYRDYDAAAWEFRYGSGGGQLHALNLGLVVDDQYGFALYFQTAEGNWEDSQDVFEAFKASFQPPDG